MLCGWLNNRQKMLISLNRNGDEVYQQSSANSIWKDRTCSCGIRLSDLGLRNEFWFNQNQPTTYGILGPRLPVFHGWASPCLVTRDNSELAGRTILSVDSVDRLRMPLETTFLCQMTRCWGMLYLEIWSICHWSILVKHCSCSESSRWEMCPFWGGPGPRDYRFWLVY